MANENAQTVSDNLSGLILTLVGTTFKNGGIALIAYVVLYFVKDIAITLTDLLEKLLKKFHNPLEQDDEGEDNDGKQQELEKDDPNWFARANLVRGVYIIASLVTGAMIKRVGKILVDPGMMDWLTELTGGGESNLSGTVCTMTGFSLQAAGNAAICIAVLYLVRATSMMMTNILEILPKMMTNPRLALFGVEKDQTSVTGLALVLRFRVSRYLTILALFAVGMVIKRSGVFCLDPEIIEWATRITGD